MLWAGLIAEAPTAQTAAQTAAQQIDKAAHDYLQHMMNTQAQTNGWKGMRVVIEITPIGSTNSIAPCPTQIKVSGGNTGRLSRQQLTLECTGQTLKGWPVKVSSDMQVFLPVVVSSAVINRGDTITRAQLQLQENEITRAKRGFYYRLDQVAGMGAKRRIRANQMLSPDLIDQPQLIKRGDKIKITANRDGITASMPGEALENGSKDEVIRVKNLSSGKTIEAKVVETGVVTSTY